MTPDALRRLLLLAEAAKARDLARLDALRQAERAEVEAAARARAAHAEDHASGAFSAAPAPLQERRLAWADHRVAEARRVQAALRPALQEARSAAVRSVGKHRAMEHLLDRAEAEARARREARLERDAPPPQPGDPPDR